MSAPVPWSLSRRSVLKLIGAGAGASALGACSGSSTDATASVDVMFDFTYAGKPGGMAAYWKEIQKRIARDGDVKIASLSEVAAADLVTRIRTADAARSGPDYRADFPNYTTFESVQRETLASFDQFIPTSAREDWLIAAAPVNGKSYVSPLFLEMIPLFSNNELLQEAGVKFEPEGTWDDFFASLQQIRAAGITPVSLGSGEGGAPSLERWIDSFIMEFADDKSDWPAWAAGQLPEDSDFATVWTDRIGQMTQAGIFNTDASKINQQTAHDRFVEGEAAFCLAIPGLMFELPESEQQKFDVYPYWRGEGLARADMVVEGSGMCMASYGNPEGAAKLAEFTHQPEQLELFNKLTGEIPANRNFDATGLGKLQSGCLDIIRESTVEAWWPPDYASIDVVFNVIIPVGQKIVSGKLAPGDARAELVSEIQSWRDSNAEQVETMKTYAESLG